MISIFKFVSFFILILICNIPNVFCAVVGGDSCVVQKQNFAACIQELEERNLIQDDAQTKIVRNKISGCFTDNECEVPNYDKVILPPVNVTDRLKQSWTTLPDSVQECIKKELRDKTAIKLATCITNEEKVAPKPKPDSTQAPKKDPQAPVLKGFKLFFQTRSRVIQYLETCKEVKGDAAYLKATACVQEIFNYVEDQICMRYSSCQFEKVDTNCLQSNRETQSATCKCRRDRLKATVKAVGDLLDKAAKGQEVPLDDLANAMGHNEGNDTKKDSQLSKCFTTSGVTVPDNPIVTTAPIAVAAIPTTPAGVAETTKSSLTEVFTSNIIVSKQQIANTLYLLEGRMDDEMCKCGS
jgi:hypothetical protein